MEPVTPILIERYHKDLGSYWLLSKLHLCRATSCLRPMEDKILVENYQTHMCHEMKKEHMGARYSGTYV